MSTYRQQLYELLCEIERRLQIETDPFVLEALEHERQDLISELKFFLACEAEEEEAKTQQKGGW